MLRKASFVTWHWHACQAWRQEVQVACTGLLEMMLRMRDTAYGVLRLIWGLCPLQELFVPVLPTCESIQSFPWLLNLGITGKSIRVSSALSCKLLINDYMEQNWVQGRPPQEHRQGDGGSGKLPALEKSDVGFF